MDQNDEIVFGGDATDIPPGTYPATVKSIITKESKAFGQFRAWDFELANGSIVGGGSSMATGSKSKAGKWIVAILGHKPEQGERVDLIGKPCLVVVDTGDDGWPKIEAVLPPMAAAGTGTPAAAATPPAAAPEPVQKVDDIKDLPF